MSRHSEPTARSNAGALDERRRLLEETIEREQHELLNDIVLYLWDFRVATSRDVLVTLAEEVFQKTVVTALGIADRYDTARPAGLWLRGIAVKEILHLRRDQGRERQRLTLVADSEPVRRAVSRRESRELSETELFDLLSRPHAGTGSAQSPTAEELLALVEGDMREVLRLYYVEGWSGEELAAKYGTSIEAVHQRLCRARNQLRRAYFGGES